MPTFNFQVVNVVKKSRPQKDKSDNTYQIIQRKVVGVVHVDIHANYYVVVNNEKYTIAEECYTCKDKRKLYRQGEYDFAKVVWIRAINFNSMNINYWLPFTVGCVVTGNIVSNNITNKFIIIDVSDEINDKTHDALVYYRKHIKEINDTIREHRERPTR